MNGKGKNKNKEIDYLKIFLNIFLKILMIKGFSLMSLWINLFNLSFLYLLKNLIKNIYALNSDINSSFFDQGYESIP